MTGDPTTDPCSPAWCSITEPPHVASQHLLVFDDGARAFEVIVDKPLLHLFDGVRWPGPLPMDLESTVAWLAAEHDAHPLVMRRLRAATVNPTPEMSGPRRRRSGSRP